MGVKVREREPGEWWIYIDHKGRRKAVKVGSEVAAIKAAKKMEEGFATGSSSPRRRRRSSSRNGTRRGLAGQHVGTSCEESTANTYRNLWKNHVKDHFGKLTIDMIDRDKIREFFRVKTEAGYSKNTIRNMRNLISGVMALSIEDRAVDANPASRTGKYLKAARKAEFLTPEEIRLLLDGTHGIFYPFFLTAVRTGLRQGELIGLQWGNIDWNGKFLTVRRTHDTPEEGEGPEEREGANGGYVGSTPEGAPGSQGGRCRGSAQGGEGTPRICLHVEVQ